MSKQSNVVSLKRELKVWHVVVIGLAYMSPFAVFDTFGIIAELTNGHVPASYIMLLISIFFTVYSYSKMAQAYPTSGSAYTYTRKTISNNLGFVIGWVLLLDYLFLPMINAAFIKLYLAPIMPGVPEWIWVIGLIVFITILNIIGVKVTVTANTIMILFQTFVVIFFTILTLRMILAEDVGYFSFEFFYSQNMEFSTVFAGASILMLSFLGFDAVTTLSDETVNPAKNIPKAIFLIALIGGIFFLTVAYFMQSLVPQVEALLAISPDAEEASSNLALYIGGNLFGSLFAAGAMVACIASGLAGQTSGSRLLYAMGRDGVLNKKIFGYVNPRTATPVYNVIITGLLACSALFLDIYTATSLINFGAFTGFAFVNLTVIFYYFRVRKEKNHTFKSILGYVIIPFIGFAYNFYLWFNLDKTALTFGMIWTAVGFLYLLYITKFFTKAPPEIAFEESEAV